MNGDAIDWVLRPPRLEGRKDIFALYVEDVSMVPAFRPGGLIFVDRIRKPDIGDDVVVEIAPANARDEQRALLKRLVGRSGSTVRLEQFNPAKVIELPEKQIINLYRVMTMMDLLGGF